MHNAFNMELIAELTDAFKTIADQPTIRMMILRGNGHTFSAGADLNWMKRAATHTKEDNVRDAVNLAEMLQSLYEMPQMTLAMVQGGAMGGGAGLVAACDVAVAMSNTKFRFLRSPPRPDAGHDQPLCDRRHRPALGARAVHDGGKLRRRLRREDRPRPVCRRERWKR